MTISETITRIREKAKDLKINIGFDDEDVIIFMLNYLYDNMEDIWCDDGSDDSIDIRQDESE